MTKIRKRDEELDTVQQQDAQVTKKLKSDKKIKKDKKSDKKAKKSDKKDKKSSKESKKTTTTSTSPVSAKPEVAAYRAEKYISLQGNNSSEFDPIFSFSDAPFPIDMMTYCKAFTTPSPIQAQSWPIVNAGRDLVGISATGSGKTLCFALPALSHARKLNESDLANNVKYHNKNGNHHGRGKQQGRYPSVLVLSPTRELALQSATVVDGVLKTAKGLSSVCVYGGVDKFPQRKDLERGTDVVIATPGRLLDLVQEGSCYLGRISFLVLDEADRMLDMGFEPDIRAIVGHINAGENAGKRQTIMFSATWPPQIRKLANEYLKDPVVVTVRPPTRQDEDKDEFDCETLSANRSVTQRVEVLEPKDKDYRLKAIIQDFRRTNPKAKILVFALYKKEAVRVESVLQYAGYSDVLALQGDLNQHKREEALESFRVGSCSLLVATDVAARGLDVKDIELVINYTFPLTIEDYVHRIGRTGRAGKTGIAHTFFTVIDKPKAGELQKVLRESGQEVPEDLKAFGGVIKRKEHSMYGNHFGDNRGGAPLPKASHTKFTDDD
jgi:ATP-dependent RNA helicase DBP3